MGLVGCGQVGRKRFSGDDSIGLVACVDQDPGRADELARSSGARVEVDLLSLAQADDIHAVVVATTHDSLTEVADLLVRAGKHVLIEKPGAMSSSELRAVAASAELAGVHVAVGYNHRFHPGIRQAIELVEDGVLGPIHMVRAVYGHGGRPGYESEWRMDPARSGGGELLDQGVHLLDLARCVLGDLRVSAAVLPTVFWKTDVEDNAYLLVEGAGPSVGFLHASWTEWKNTFRFEVAGRVGTVRVDGLGGSYGVERCTHHQMSPAMGPPATVIHEYPLPDASWRHELADFVDAVQSTGAANTPKGATLADAIAVLQLVEASYAMAAP